MINNEMKIKDEWERGFYYKFNTIVTYNDKMYLVINPCEFESTIEPNKDNFNYKLLINSKEDKKTFNEEIVDNLKKEILSLNKSINRARENGEFSQYKNLINSYRDVVKLIQDLDWQFKYSEYKTEVANNVFQKEIAIWEQNGDGQIRNYKKWIIQECKADGCNNTNN